MLQRYEDCSIEEKIILKSIKEMYITGICLERTYSPQEWVQKVLSRNNELTFDNIKWKYLDK